MTEVRVEHALEPAEVLARLEGLARSEDVTITTSGANRGSLTKATAFGQVGGEYEIEPAALVVRVVNRPAFLPEGMVQRLLEENLRQLLAE